MTVKEIKKFNTAHRVKLLKALIDSFDQVNITALYGEEEVITSENIKRGVSGRVVSIRGAIEKTRSNNIVIVTSICTG